MLRFAGKDDARFKLAHDRILESIESVLKDGPHTADLGGNATTADIGSAIADRILASGHTRAISR
jgi:tartrate dehydrogenase/decarboxylase/D-malate dehydrogenase